MIDKYLIFSLLLFLQSMLVSEQAASSICAKDEILVPITYQFKDRNAQYAWVYKTLYPVLNTRRPESKNVVDGELKLEFCIKNEIEDNMRFQAGPRLYDISSRPTYKNKNGDNQMSMIYLAGQDNPDWVVIKSFERNTLEPDRIPIIDLELFNFGSVHPGGRVLFSTHLNRWSCSINDHPRHVLVEVKLSGQRLAIATTDPEYPEDLISRTATIESGYCMGNFNLQASFGPTGRLPHGPTRIRYKLINSSVIQDVDPKQNIYSVYTLERGHGYFKQYFLDGEYDVKVEGEGIWQ